MKPHLLSPVKVPLARLATAKVPFAPGIYILYRTNMGAPAYIGRDDVRLYDKLNDLSRNQPHYHYFKFMVCSDPTDAYQWECMFWHKGLSTLDNAAHHPRPPRGLDLACPFPGCSHVHKESASANEEIGQDS
jgi:hypothetical protein